MKTVILFISSFFLYCAGMFYSIVVAANYTPGKMEVEGANESNEPVYWINAADYPSEADYHPLDELTESELESLLSAEEAGIDPKDPILPQDMIGIIATDQRGVEIQLAHGVSSDHCGMHLRFSLVKVPLVLKICRSGSIYCCINLNTPCYCIDIDYYGIPYGFPGRIR